MRPTALAGCAVALAIVTTAAIPQRTHAQANDPPNPYRTVENWAKLPDGRKWGQTIGVDVDPDGIRPRVAGFACAFDFDHGHIHGRSNRGFRRHAASDSRRHTG